jgi:hypothetical protein
LLTALQRARSAEAEPLWVLGICSWTAYTILAQRWFAPDTPQLRRTDLTTVGAVVLAGVLYMRGQRARTARTAAVS